MKQLKDERKKGQAMKPKKRVTYYTASHLTTKQKKKLHRIEIAAYIITWILCWGTVVALVLNDTLQEIVARPFDVVRGFSKVVLCKIFCPKLIFKRKYKIIYMDDNEDEFGDLIIASYNKKKVALAILNLRGNKLPTKKEVKRVMERGLNATFHDYDKSNEEIEKRYPRYKFRWV